MQEKQNKNAEISARIRQVIDYLDIKANVFAKNLGYIRSQTVYDIINSKSAPSFDFFNKFANSEYSEIIGLEWLLTGKGEMLEKKSEDFDSPKLTAQNDSTKQDFDSTKRQHKDFGTAPDMGGELSPPENVFSGLTQEEVDKELREGIRDYLLDMYENGRAYPAAVVREYQAKIEALTTQVARLEYKNGELMTELAALRGKTGASKGLKATEKGVAGKE